MDDLVFGEPAALHLWSFRLGQSLPQTGLGAGGNVSGYQPAQKWLKDRKGRALTFDDVKHYQRILKILSETDRIMQTITMTLEAA